MIFISLSLQYCIALISKRTTNDLWLQRTDGEKSIFSLSLFLYNVQIRHVLKMTLVDKHIVRISAYAQVTIVSFTLYRCVLLERRIRNACVSLCCYKWEQTLTHVWEKKERNFNRIITFTGYSMEYKNILFLKCISYVCSIQNMKKWQCIILSLHCVWLGSITNTRKYWIWFKLLYL